jgi:hypothetical protein
MGTLPLAVLGQLSPGVELEPGLREIVGRLLERLQKESPPEVARRLATAAFVLSGMRVNRENALNLFQGIRAMEESTTFQWILEQGAIAELQKMLLGQGRKRLGEPNEDVKAALKAITDLDRLERLGDQVIDASTWQELLETP